MTHREIAPHAIFVFTHPAAIELVMYNPEGTEAIV